MLSLPTLLLAGFCLVFLILRDIHQRLQRRKNARQWGCQSPNIAPSGFFGIPPFLDLAKAIRQSRPVEFITEKYNIHGFTFKQSFLGRTGVSTIEPENLKAVLATQFNDFCLGLREREFGPLLGQGIFTLDGPGWSHARALLRPQFTRDQVADLDLMESHISRMIELMPKDGSTFDIQRLFFLMTTDSSTHFLFGESVHSMDEDTLLKRSTVNNSEGFADAFNTSLHYLNWRAMAGNFYWMVTSKEFRDANRRVKEVVDYYVHQAIEARRHPEKKEPGRYIFAEALAEDNDDPKILRDNMLNILLAGRDTTASLLSSVFFFLARNPAVWDKLRRIIVEEFGDDQHPNEKITQTKLKDLPYLRYVLNEALRLLPPVPLNARIATKDTSLPVGGGPDGKSPVFIAKGQLLLYSVYAMHRRKDLWGPDADSFRPERWEENAKRGWEYLPFNGGPRICLGQQYALTEASYTIVRLMQRFSKIENGEPDRDQPLIRANLTMSHGDGVKIRLY
ncbi:cytochrome P450 [Aspergillus mulundensis]|uniref:Putative Cytochrome P450 n=1 Tax=Aspergillus mulundensis TaxID=1810919 RepID=A0A3D8QZX6_9EURO|nr:putative Cytochrome P450 [Aspergillus mulundensis]RDW67220.1 putative Cytochrome P450 [Aspergillus mulundensis]